MSINIYKVKLRMKCIYNNAETSLRAGYFLVFTLTTFIGGNQKWKKSTIRFFPLQLKNTKIMVMIIIQIIAIIITLIIIAMDRHKSSNNIILQSWRNSVHIREKKRIKTDSELNQTSNNKKSHNNYYYTVLKPESGKNTKSMKKQRSTLSHIYSMYKLRTFFIGWMGN